MRLCVRVCQPEPFKPDVFLRFIPASAALSACHRQTQFESSRDGPMKSFCVSSKREGMRARVCVMCVRDIRPVKTVNRCLCGGRSANDEFLKVKKIWPVTVKLRSNSR